MLRSVLSLGMIFSVLTPVLNAGELLLSGIVTDKSSGKPIPHVNVVIYHPNNVNRLTISSKTDRDGKYLLKTVSGKSALYVSAYRKGFDPQIIEVDLPEGNAPQTVDFSLTKRTEGQPSPPKLEIGSPPLIAGTVVEAYLSSQGSAVTGDWAVHVRDGWARGEWKPIKQASLTEDCNFFDVELPAAIINGLEYLEVRFTVSLKFSDGTTVNAEAATILSKRSQILGEERGQ